MSDLFDKSLNSSYGKYVNSMDLSSWLFKLGSSSISPPAFTIFCLISSKTISISLLSSPFTLAVGNSNAFVLSPVILADPFIT